MGPKTLSISFSWSKSDILNLAGFCSGSFSQVSLPSPASGMTAGTEISSREGKCASVERGLYQLVPKPKTRLQKHNLNYIIVSTNVPDCLALDCSGKYNYSFLLNGFWLQNWITVVLGVLCQIICKKTSLSPLSLHVHS